MTASVSETVPAVDDFTAEWNAWHRRQEARLADPHGFLAITSLNWLTDEPQRFPDAPGSGRPARTASSSTSPRARSW
jgi:uncharacterized protein (DUF1684 family)